MAYAAIGSSVAAACVVATVYWLMGIMNIAMGRISKYPMYYLMGVAAIVRGVAMVVRGISITQDESSKGMAVLYFMCVQAGFGLSLDMQCLVIAEWHRPPLAKLWQIIATLGGPCAIMFGPGLGVANAVLYYGYGTPGTLHASAIARKVSATGLFSVAAVCTLLALGATLHAVRRAAEFAPRDHPHQKVSVLVVTSALLAWAGAARVATQFTQPHVATTEALFYTMQVLPEMLQMAIWCVPYLVAEAHHSCGFDEWWNVSRHGKSASGAMAASDGDASTTSLPDVDVEAPGSKKARGLTTKGGVTAAGERCNAGVENAPDGGSKVSGALPRTLTMLSGLSRGSTFGWGASMVGGANESECEQEGELQAGEVEMEGDGGCDAGGAAVEGGKEGAGDAGVHPKAANDMDLAGLTQQQGVAASAVCVTGVTQVVCPGSVSDIAVCAEGGPLAPCSQEGALHPHQQVHSHQL